MPLLFSTFQAVSGQEESILALVLPATRLTLAVVQV